MNGDLKESGPFSLTCGHMQYVYVHKRGEMLATCTQCVEHEREKDVEVVVDP